VRSHLRQGLEEALERLNYKLYNVAQVVGAQVDQRGQQRSVLVGNDKLALRLLQKPLDLYTSISLCEMLRTKVPCFL
jgi:hypothetical protein